MSELRIAAFIERLQEDSECYSQLEACLKEWAATEDSYYEYVAHFARESGFSVEAEDVQGNMDSRNLSGIFDSIVGPKSSKRRLPSGPLAPVVNPKKLSGDHGSGGGGVFDHLYGRIGPRGPGNP